MGGRTNGSSDGGSQDEEGDIPTSPGQQGGSNGHGPEGGSDEDRMGGGAPADDDDE